MIKFLSIIQLILSLFLVSTTFAQNTSYDTLQESKNYLIYFNSIDTSMNFYDKNTGFSHKEKEKLWSVGWMGTYTPKPYLSSLQYSDDSIMVFSFTDFYENTFTYVSRYFYLYDGKEFKYIRLSDHQPEKYDYLISFGLAQPYKEKIIFKRRKNKLKIKMKFQVYSEGMKSKQKIVKKYILDTRWNEKRYFRRTYLKHVSPFWIE